MNPLRRALLGSGRLPDELRAALVAEDPCIERDEADALADELLPSGSARFGPLAVTLATVICVGVLRWPMLPVVLCLAPISIGLALVRRRNA